MSLTSFSEEQRELRRQRHISRKEVRRPPRGDLQHYLTTALQPEQPPTPVLIATVGGAAAAAGIDAAVTMTAAYADALMMQSEKATSTRQSFGSGTTAVHRPWTAGHAGSSGKKKKLPPRAHADDDISHVTADLERIRLRAVKDARKTWRAAESLMMPSTRAQVMVVRLLDEEPIAFRSKDIQREDMFDRYRHFQEYDRIREEAKLDAKRKSVSFT